MSKALNVAVCQVNPTLGNFQKNIDIISKNYKYAVEKGADLVVFPEMSITGYPPQDLLNNKEFISQNISCLNELTKSTTIPCIFGYVDFEDNKKFNAAAVCQDGEIVYKYYKIALQICEDLWEDEYERKISEEIIENDPDLIINISASPFAKDRKNDRMKLIQSKYKDANCPFIYCNLVGGQDELIFDGFSMIFNSESELIDIANGFEEQILITDLNSRESIEKISPNEQLFKALSLGIKDYFIKTGHEKAVIGLSGGIDSALVACLAVDALGSENVSLISMPSRFSSDHSKIDAKQLAKNLDANFKTVDIDSLFQAYLDIMNIHFDGSDPNVAEENIQSRIRGNILMAFSNKFGSLVLSTGNKTELALGYCTLYGDMSGGLSAIGDLNKTEVYELSKWINKDNEIIPINIIDKEPSAELAPNQVDPFDYDLISPIVDKIIFGDENEQNEQYLSLKKKIDINEHKRRQAAPVLRVSKKAFGIGRRIPIVNHFNE